MNVFFFRCNILVDNAEQASIEMDKLAGHIKSRFKLVEITPPEQYWKMPEYYQSRITFITPTLSVAEFSEMLYGFSSGCWTIYTIPEDDRWAIWQTNGIANFLDTNIKWICVQEITGHYKRQNPRED